MMELLKEMKKWWETVELEEAGTAESHHNNTTVYLFLFFLF